MDSWGEWQPGEAGELPAEKGDLINQAVESFSGRKKNKSGKVDSDIDQSIQKELLDDLVNKILIKNQTTSSSHQ